MQNSQNYTKHYVPCIATRKYTISKKNSKTYQPQIFFAQNNYSCING